MGSPSPVSQSDNSVHDGFRTDSTDLSGISFTTITANSNVRCCNGGQLGENVVGMTTDVASRSWKFRRSGVAELEMHALFASRGVTWREVFDAKLAGARPETRLKNIVAANKHACWILFCDTEPIHRWFASARVPALVVGTCAPGTNLPSVDLDYGAVGWHAAGMMVSHAHKKMALIVPSNPFSGDIAFREAFLRYVAERSVGSSVVELSAPENICEFRAKLYQLLSGPDRPSAILSMRAHLTLALLISLHRTGLRIPEDLSLISRNSERLLEMAAPDLTRYNTMTPKLATRVVGIAMKLLAGRHVPAKPSLITPAFVYGATLRRGDEAR